MNIKKKPIKGKEMNKQRQDAQRKRKKRWKGLN